MWDFPRVPTPIREPGHSNGRSTSLADVTSSNRAADIRAELKQRFRVTVRSLDEFLTIRHAVTRFRITLHCLQAEARSKQVAPPARWFGLPEMAELPLTTPARRISRKLG